MKQSTYLETSVVGAYLDNGEPFRRDLTIRWWEHELSEYRAVISPLVTRELERVAEPHRSAYLKLITGLDRKSTRLNSSHVRISYAVFCLKKKKKKTIWSTYTS